MPKMTAAERLADAKRSVREEAKRKVAARKAAAGKKASAKKAPTPKKTRGITNIIKKRSSQAERIFKQASR